MIYIDANIFIHPLIGNDSKSENALRFLKKVSSGEQKACTSVLTWDEFLYIITKQMGREKAIEQSKTLLQTTNLVWLEATEEIISYAQQLVEKYLLKPRDAIHASTAILNNCSKIISDDSDFDKIKEITRQKIA